MPESPALAEARTADCSPDNAKSKNRLRKSAGQPLQKLKLLCAKP
jgi:hypothetical protein